MVYLKIIRGKYRGGKDIFNVLHYILNEKKNPHAIHNLYDMSMETIKKRARQFEIVQEKYRKTSGKRIIHMIISYKENCPYTYDEYTYVGERMTDFFDGYQVVYSLHEKDKNQADVQPHIHVAINPINYRTGKRLRIDKKVLRELKDYVSNLLVD